MKHKTVKFQCVRCERYVPNLNLHIKQMHTKKKEAAK